MPLPATLGRRPFTGPISWIAPAGASNLRGCHFRARRTYRSTEITATTLYITAESVYALYINGQRIGIGPARGTETCNYLDEYDLTPYLDTLELHILVEVFCNNFPTFTAAPAEPAVFVQLGKHVTDTSWQVQIAPDWRGGDVPNYSFQIGLIEWRDYRITPDSTPWQPATIQSIDKQLYYRDVAMCRETRLLPQAITPAACVQPTGPLKPEEIAACMSREPHTPLPLDLTPLTQSQSVTLYPLGRGEGVTFVADPHQAYIGGFELDIEASAGTIIDVGNDEQFAAGRLTFDRNGMRMVDRYIHSGGRHLISNELHSRGGRFLQFAIRDFDAPVTLHRLHFMDRRYPVDTMAAFKCDNEQYNQLWSRCQSTMSACATDTLMDCPWREQAFWVNDMLVQNLYWLQLAGQPDLLRRSLSLALSQPTDAGLIPGVCPTDGNPAHVLFPVSLYLPIILRDYLKYTDDSQYAAEVLPAVTAAFEACQQFANSDNLLTPPRTHWNFIDWSYLTHDAARKEYPLNGRNTCVVNWFNVLAHTVLAELHTELSQLNTQLAELPANLAEAPCYLEEKSTQIAQAIARRFWDQDAKLFNEWSDSPDGDMAEPAGCLTHALALLSGHLSPDLVPHAHAALQRGGSALPELYMQHFVIQALADSGQHAAALQLIDRYWCPMLVSDNPTIWESNVYQHGQTALWGVGSLCHAFALAPVTFFQQQVLGIRPLTAAFSTFAFSPHCLDLQQASGTVPTPTGWIHATWKRDGECLNATLEVPPGTRAVLDSGQELPSGKHEFRLSLTRVSS